MIHILGVDVPGRRIGKPFDCAHLLLVPSQGESPRDRSLQGRFHLERLLSLSASSAVVGYAQEIQATVVAVDCPLPPGSVFSKEFQENFPPNWPKVRPAEAELRKRGYSYFPTTPTTFRSFQEMLLKGWQLYWELWEGGYSLKGDRGGEARWAIEVYPFAAFEELREKGKTLPLKTTQQGRRERQRLLGSRIEGIPSPEDHLLSADFLDALVCALTGGFFLQGQTLALGIGQIGGPIHLPLRRSC